MRKTKIGNKSKEDWILDILKVIVLSIVTIITVYPFWNIFIISINDATDAIRGGLYFLPRKLSFSSYLEILTKKTFLSSIKVSVARTVIGTPIAVLVTSMLAYALSRRDLVGRKFWNLLFIFTMYFNGGLIPSYLLIKDLGLINSRLSLILPGAVSTFNLMIMITGFEGIPQSLEESARIDGAGDWTILFRIIMPLAKPTIMVILLYYAVGHWNSWFNAMIYLRDAQKMPIQIFLRDILTRSQLGAMTGQTDVEDVGQTIKYATIIVSTVPILCIYPFIQKHFVKGVMIGAVKE